MEGEEDVGLQQPLELDVDRVYAWQQQQLAAAAVPIRCAAPLCADGAYEWAPPCVAAQQHTVRTAHPAAARRSQQL